MQSPYYSEFEERNREMAAAGKSRAMALIAKMQKDSEIDGDDTGRKVASYINAQRPLTVNSDEIQER